MDTSTRENVAFDIEIMRMTGNECVMAQASLVRITSQIFTPVALLEADRARLAVQQHGDIAKAIAGGQGGAAERAARKHIRSTIDGVIREERRPRGSSTKERAP